MKRSLIALAATSLIMLSGAASASSYDLHEKVSSPSLDKSNVELSVGYTNFNADGVGIDVNLSAVTIGFGYEFKTDTSNISVVPEVYIGKGVDDDNIGGGYEVELEHYIQFGTRLTLNPTDEFYAYIRPTLTRAQIAVNDASSGVKLDGSESDWELGVGVGAGMYFTKSFSATLAYDRVDSDTDSVSLTARYHF